MYNISNWSKKVLWFAVVARIQPEESVGISDPSQRPDMLGGQAEKEPQRLAEITELNRTHICPEVDG